MVNDTLGISKCGSDAIKLNYVINSFIQSERLTFLESNSFVNHKQNKYTLPKIENQKGKYLILLNTWAIF